MWPWVQIPVMSMVLKTLGKRLYCLTKRGENVEPPIKERACSEKRDRYSWGAVGILGFYPPEHRGLPQDVDRYSGSPHGLK